MFCQTPGELPAGRHSLVGTSFEGMRSASHMHMNLLCCDFAGAWSPWDLPGTLLVRVPLPRAMPTLGRRPYFSHVRLQKAVLRTCTYSVHVRVQHTVHVCSPARNCRKARTELALYVHVGTSHTAC